MSDTPQTEDTMIAALLRERDGLVQRGLKDRVAQVDEQLKHRGYKAPAKKAAPPAKKDSAPPAAGEKDPAEQPPAGPTQQAPQTT